MNRRTISNVSCIEYPSNSKESFRIDVKIGKFIVKKRNLTNVKSYSLGTIWNILNPLIISLIYLFVFTVIKYNSEPGNLLIGIAMIRGLQQSLIYGANSNLDFTAGMQIERVRSRAIIISELLYVSHLSFQLSIGTVCVLLLLGSSYWAILAIPVFCILNCLTWYSIGRVLSPIVQRFPDFKKIVTYFGMLMFFGSTALYPLSLTTGIHRQFNLLNPFSYIVEPARAISFGSDSYLELIPIVGIILIPLIAIFMFYGLSTIDKQRWKWSTWN